MRILLGLAALLAACNGKLPLPSFPQLEQAQQSVAGGGRRYEDYRVCRTTGTDVKTLVSCMESAGYKYLPRSAEEQAMECWRLRDDDPRGRLPEAWCFTWKGGG